MKSKVILFAFCLAFLSSCGKKGFDLSGGTPECTVRVLQPTAINLKSSYPATIKDKQDVEIRPQASGFITEVRVDEGSMVCKGQILFIIDPVQYEAAVRSAKVVVVTARAGVDTQEIIVNNKRGLNKKNIINDYNLAMAGSFLASAKTQLASAQAQLINAEQSLTFINVKNPSGGIVSTIPYRLGSLASPSIQTPLAIVSDTNEMYVYSSLTGGDLLALVRRGGSRVSTVESYPKVGFELSSGATCADKGRMSTVSGVISQNTRAISIRATFPNEGHLLRSGGTANLIVPYHLESVVVIPQKTVTEIRGKKFAFVLQSNSTVKVTEINVFSVGNGYDYVVTSSLKTGEEAVLDNASTLKNKQAIKPVTPEQAKANFQQALEGKKQGK